MVLLCVVSLYSPVSVDVMIFDFVLFCALLAVLLPFLIAVF